MIRWGPGQLLKPLVHEERMLEGLDIIVHQRVLGIRYRGSDQPRSLSRIVLRAASGGVVALQRVQREEERNGVVELDVTIGTGTYSGRSVGSNHIGEKDGRKGSNADVSFLEG